MTSMSVHVEPFATYVKDLLSQSTKNTLALEL